MSDTPGPKAEDETPVVSVVMISFNQAKYVAQAIESVVGQQTSFPFELVIGDDMSTDGTRDVIDRYASEYPGIIRRNYPPQNLGAIRNFATQIDAARGRYIAFCEGDDYWTDDKKLQRQVDFLEQNPDCALCHHRVSYWSESDGQVVKEFPPEEFRQTRSGAERLAQANFIQTCALMVRRNCVPELSEGFRLLTLGDWPLCALVAQRGSIGYIDHSMAMYRLHPTGLWSTATAFARLEAAKRMGEFLIAHLAPEHRRVWADFMLNVHTGYIGHYRSQGQSVRALRQVVRGIGFCLRTRPRALPYNLVRWARQMIVASENAA